MKPSLITSQRLRSRHPQAGQTMMFLVMILVILSFVMFSVFDTQHVIVQRVRSQNGSDAAALTGAKWQLSTLNAIGEINLLKVTSTIVNSGPLGPAGPGQYQSLYGALDKLQAEIYMMGPLMGVFYTQQAAKLNGMHNIDDFAKPFYDLSQFITDHPELIGDSALNRFDPSERPQVLQTYAAMVKQIADQGVAAWPANAWGTEGDLDFSNASPYAHYLADREFYGAIAGQDWCWLKPLLWIYTDWTFWGPVQAPVQGLSPFRFLNVGVTWKLDSNLGLSEADQNSLLAAVQEGITQRGAEINPNWPGGDNGYDHGFHYTNDLPRFDSVGAQAQVQLWWAVYDNPWNGNWDSALVSQLLVSGVKEQYDYTGADSVWMVQASANISMAVIKPSVTSYTAKGQEAGLGQALSDLASLKSAASKTGHGITASAAAKAFGQNLDNTKPNQYGVVLPVFDAVRLIPIVFSSAGGDFDPQWLEHLYMHVPPYTTKGLAALVDGCTFCDCLRTWENSAFRKVGQDWFLDLKHKCDHPHHGGRGGLIVH